MKCMKMALYEPFNKLYFIFVFLACLPATTHVTVTLCVRLVAVMRHLL